MTALLVVIAATVPYLAAVRRYQRRRQRRWGRRRTASWLSGAVLLALGLSPVMESLGSEPVAHMVQHLLLGMFAPLTLVMGAPMTLLLATLDAPAARRVAHLLATRPVRVLAHPLTAAVLSVGGMLVLYLTPLAAMTEGDDGLHRLVHAHVIASGCLFAWSISGPDPSRHRPPVATRAVVLVLAGGVHGFLAKLLYAHAGALPPGWNGDVAELRAAAQWLYYGGDVAELLLAAALFAGWYRRRGQRARAHRGADTPRVCTSGRATTVSVHARAR
ncbi:MAG: cytochrome c oxidase assembly protein [Actinomycetes bacterium]